MNVAVISRYFLIFSIIFSFAFSAGGKVVAAISTLKGLVLVKPVGSRKFIPAYKGQMLKSGEWVKTKDGVFVSIVFLDGSNIKIQQKSEVKVTSYRMTAKALKTSLEMKKGQAWSDVAAQGSAGEFKIATPTAVASVKGTELDLAYDAVSGESTLIVLEGSVEFIGDLGTILVGAMQSSKNGGAVSDLSPEELPNWQKSTDAKWTFKLKKGRGGKRKVGDEVKVEISMLNAKNKSFDDSFSGVIKVETQTSELKVSSDGSSWSNSIDINIVKGKGVVKVKSSKQGLSSIIVNADDSESKLMEFEYFQSKTQKRASKGKLAGLAAAKGAAQLTKLLEEKDLLGSQVTGGMGSVDDILKKLETGELELDGEPVFIYNDDGTVTVKMVAKPR